MPCKSDMKLSPLELELSAVSISVAAGCVACTKYHIGQCERLSAAENDIRNSVRLGGRLSAAALYDTWNQFDASFDVATGQESGRTVDRQHALCGIGVAVAGNAVEQLAGFLRHARDLGIRDAEAMAIIGLAERIKKKAATHLETLIGSLDADRNDARNVADLCA